MDSHIFPLWDGWPTKPNESHVAWPRHMWCLVWFSNTLSSLAHLQDLSSTSVQLLGLKRDDLLRQSYSGRSSTKQTKNMKTKTTRKHVFILTFFVEIPMIAAQHQSENGRHARCYRTAKKNNQCCKMYWAPRTSQRGPGGSWELGRLGHQLMHFLRNNYEKCWSIVDIVGFWRYFKTMLYYVTQAALSRCSFLCWERKRIKQL